MRTNFKIEDNYAVMYAEEHIDLHNNFEFEGMSENFERSEIQLKFIKRKDSWVRENEFENLTFILKNVTFTYYEEGDTGDYPEDSKCLGEISFFPSDMRNINDSIMVRPEPQDPDDILFFFEDGRLIRIHCAEAELIAER